MLRLRSFYIVVSCNMIRPPQTTVYIFLTMPSSLFLPFFSNTLLIRWISLQRTEKQMVRLWCMRVIYIKWEYINIFTHSAITDCTSDSSKSSCCGSTSSIELYIGTTVNYYYQNESSFDKYLHDKWLSTPAIEFSKLWKQLIWLWYSSPYIPHFSIRYRIVI